MCKLSNYDRYVVYPPRTVWCAFSLTERESRAVRHNPEIMSAWNRRPIEHDVVRYIHIDGPAELRAFMLAPQQCRSLVISRTRIHAAVMHVIAQLLLSSTVMTTLDLSRNNIGPDGAVALAGQRHWQERCRGTRQYSRCSCQTTTSAMRGWRHWWGY